MSHGFNLQSFDSGIGQAASGEEWATFVLEALDNESVLLAQRRDPDRHRPTRSSTSLTSRTTAPPTSTTSSSRSGPGIRPETISSSIPWKCAALTTLSRRGRRRLERRRPRSGRPSDDPRGRPEDGRGAVRRRRRRNDRAGRDHELRRQRCRTSTTPGRSPTRTSSPRAARISAYGGRADSLYMNPADFTTLQLATAGDDRPLIQPDASQGAAATVAGYPGLPDPGARCRDRAPRRGGADRRRREERCRRRLQRGLAVRLRRRPGPGHGPSRCRGRAIRTGLHDLVAKPCVASPTGRRRGSAGRFSHAAAVKPLAARRVADHNNFRRRFSYLSWVSGGGGTGTWRAGH